MMRSDFQSFISSLSLFPPVYPAIFTPIATRAAGESGFSAEFPDFPRCKAIRESSYYVCYLHASVTLVALLEKCYTQPLQEEEIDIISGMGTAERVLLGYRKRLPKPSSMLDLCAPPGGFVTLVKAESKWLNYLANIL